MHFPRAPFLCQGSFWRQERALFGGKKGLFLAARKGSFWRPSCLRLPVLWIFCLFLPGSLSAFCLLLLQECAHVSPSHSLGALLLQEYVALSLIGRGCTKALSIRDEAVNYCAALQV